ncbi:MAG TPA: hypothetical protein VEW67_04315 [Thermoleophilaceae bacterium]|nr:hypothetical protein [Thermoleophilaceae bacterium]
MAGGDRTTGAEQELIARLDRVFAHQRDLDPAVLASVRAWQKTDRTYELVQKIARGHSMAGTSQLQVRSASRVRRHLVLAIQSGRLPLPLRVFRGLRDIEVSLGFSRPSRVVGLDLSVPVGTPALWVAGVGHGSLRRQGELLLENRTKIDVYSHVQSVDAVSVLRGRVVLDE